MFRKVALLLTLSLVGSASSAVAATITLNFDTDFANVAIPTGTLLNTAYASPDFSFGADDVARFGGAVSSLPNFAVGGLAGFSSPLDVFFTAGATGSISVFNVSNSAFLLSVYDSSNNLLASGGASGLLEHLILPFAGTAARIQFTTTDKYGIDDLTFNVNSAVQPVPEPGTWMLLGLGVVSLAARKFLRA